MIDIHYETNCGQYVMVRNGVMETAPMDTVAIGYSVDAVTGDLCRHKHGSPASVRHWAEQAKARWIASGNKEFADEIQVWEGAPPVEALNAALESEGALRRLVCPPQTIDVEAAVIAEGAAAESGDLPEVTPLSYTVLRG